MNRHRFWRLLLFLSVLILPSIGIVMQSRKITGDAKSRVEKEMTDREKDEHERVATDELRAAEESGDAMYNDLEVLKLQESANIWTGIPQDKRRTVLIGRADGNRVVWPWDAQNEEALPLMEDRAFYQAIDEARRARVGDPDRAAVLYHNLIDSQCNLRQCAVARLLLAQMLINRKRSEDADEVRDLYLNLLNLPWRLTDEYGSQISAYAAQYLINPDAGLDVSDVKRALESQKAETLGEMRLLKPVLEALAKSKALAVRHYAEEALHRVLRRIADLEEPSRVAGAAALQAGFSKLEVTASLWKPYPAPSGELWLVGKASDSPLVLVVRADAVLKDVEADRETRAVGHPFRLVASSEGKPLGRHFPDLSAVFLVPTAVDGKEPPEIPSEPLTSLWLWVVVPFTMLGGYLVWSDTRREVRVAEMRSQFVSSVSHELKTPLTAIRMFAETLQIGGADAKTHDEYLETIVNESERLTRLLNNVLDFSRIERGQKTYMLEPTPLEDVLNAAVRTMQYPLAEKGFVLSVSLCEGIPPVAADRDALQQAVLNLLTNAMKYSGKRREIEMRLTLENGSASIEVTDHGIGIPAKEQPHIFEKFYRAHVPENRAIAGTGLGLALVAHVAKAHGGSVRVESNPGDGSTFSICLPLNGAVV